MEVEKEPIGLKRQHIPQPFILCGTYLDPGPNKQPVREKVIRLVTGYLMMLQN